MLNAGKYGPCPTCGAMNMSHRQSCYRCNNPLHTGSTSRTPTATRPVTRERERRATHPRRRVPRHEMVIPNVTVQGEVVVPHSATVRDVSPFGLRMSTTVASRLGARIRLDLPLEGRVYSVQGVVRHRCPVDPATGHYYAYGVQFTEPSYVLRRILTKMGAEVDPPRDDRRRSNRREPVR